MSAQSAEPYRAHEEIFIESYGDEYIVYIPTKRVALRADRELARAFRRLKDGRFYPEDDPEGLMRDIMSIIGLNDDSTQHNTSHITEYKGQPKPTGVTLFLTTSCNLRCTYCCVSAGERASATMTPDTARYGIDFVTKNAVESNSGSIYVGFVAAGEPTVNWATLIDAYEYASRCAEKNGVALRTSLKTNGVMSPHKAEWVADNIDEIQVSMDGMPGSGGADRPTTAGHDSVPLVERTLSYFDEVGKDYKIRMTVPASRTSSMVDAVEYICLNYSPKSIQIEPAYQMGRYELSPSAETDAFLESIRRAMKVSDRMSIPVTFGGTDIDSLSNHFCGISADEFSLSANGNVTSCSTASTEDDALAGDFFYGKRTEDGYTFDMDVLETLRSRSVDNREFCSGCFAKWHCGGECHYKLLATSSVDDFAGTDRCHIVRGVVKDKLFDRIQMAGGSIWIG